MKHTKSPLTFGKLKIRHKRVVATSLMLCLFLFFSVKLAAQTDFYYSFEHKIEIEVVAGTYTIEFFDENDAVFLEEQAMDHKMITCNLFEVKGEQAFYEALAPDLFFLSIRPIQLKEGRFIC